MNCDILFVSPEFGFGGMGNHSLRIVKLLLDEGFKVCVHAVKNKKRARINHRNLQVLEIVKPFVGFDVFNPFFDLLSFVHLRNMEKPALIVRVLPPFSLNIPWMSDSTIPELAISHGVVYTRSIKDFRHKGKGGIKDKFYLSGVGRIMKESEKILLSRAKRIVAVSQYTKSNLMHVFNVSEDKIQVIHNFVDTDLFRRRKDVSSEVGAKVKEFKDGSLLAVFAFGAYPTPAKNFDLLFDTIMSLSSDIDLKFVIVGLDENNTYFRNYVEILRHHRTLFLGYVDNWLLPDVYSLADFSLITSVDENLPTVLLEAMACGSIPICATVGGIPEVVRNHENGFLIHPNKKDFVNILGEVVNYDPDKLTAISRRAEKEVKERFDIRIARRKLVDAVNETIFCK